MNLSPIEWGVLCTVASAAIGIIGYFLKRTMNTTDSHGRDINEIKRTYVTKDELKEIKSELRDMVKELSADISQLKNSCLTKDDYYRKQVESDRKVDRLYDIFLEKGGTKVE